MFNINTSPPNTLTSIKRARQSKEHKINRYFLHWNDMLTTRITIKAHSKEKLALKQTVSPNISWTREELKVK